MRLVLGTLLVLELLRRETILELCLIMGLLLLDLAVVCRIGIGRSRSTEGGSFEI